MSCTAELIEPASIRNTDTFGKLRNILAVLVLPERLQLSGLESLRNFPQEKFIGRLIRLRRSPAGVRPV